MGSCLFTKWKIPVGCKLVFSLKYKTDGSIERHKTKLVARGFTQTYGIDYQETFVLLLRWILLCSFAKMNSTRVLISCAVNMG